MKQEGGQLLKRLEQRQLMHSNRRETRTQVHVCGSNSGSLWESSSDGFHLLHNTRSKAMG